MLGNWLAARLSRRSLACGATAAQVAHERKPLELRPRCEPLAASERNNSLARKSAQINQPEPV